MLRTLTGHGKSLSYQELLNICKLDTLECRKKPQSLILLFKCISNIGPKYIKDFSFNARAYFERALVLLGVYMGK